MLTTSQALETALIHHRSGQLPEAEAIYRQVLAVEPNNIDALQLLGTVKLQQGQLEAGMECMRRVLTLNPDLPEVHNNIGTALTELGKLAEAVRHYDQAIKIKPDYAEAHFNMGNALKEQAELDAAIVCYKQAIEIKADYAEALNNLGLVLEKQGNSQAAISAYEKALKLRPDYLETQNRLGVLFQAEGNLDAAQSCFQNALGLDANYHDSFNNLGLLLQEKGNLNDAISCFEKALAIKPDCFAAHYNLGNMLQEQRRHAEAVAHYEQALLFEPNNAMTYNNMGGALQKLGHFRKAVSCFEQAIRFKPDYSGAYNNLGATLTEQGKLDKSIECYEKAVALKPDYHSALMALTHQLQHACRWKDLETMAQRLLRIVESSSETNSVNGVCPFSFLVLPISTTPQQQLLSASQWIKDRIRRGDTLRSVPTLRCAQPGTPQMLTMHRPVPRTRLPETNHSGRINLGYLSADFREHATASLIAEMIEKHNRKQFSVRAYSYGYDDGSQMRNRLTEAFDSFVDLANLSYNDAALRIEEDQVDILVDLKGFTKDCRPEILALRPAPIQVNYLGFPGTMGAAFMDYILVDDLVVPQDQQAFFTESLVHLPECYQVNDSQRKIADHTPGRVECGLPENGFVFCSFNNNYKITPDVFSIWMRLLNEVPGSVLWLLAGNDFAPENLRKEAAARGVAAERLVFAPRLPPAEHLARHRQIDLFLDTVPVNAHTTASDALWSGCPVLTICGNTFVSRVGASLLRAVGLPELITSSLDEYFSLALRLARDPDYLDELKQRLKTIRRKSSLFDAERFTRNIEKAYKTMWEIYVSKESPRPFAVTEV